MSNSQEPNQPTISDGINADLHYDDAGNPFICDANGIWIPHCGFISCLSHASRQPSNTVQGGTCPNAGHWPSDHPHHNQGRPWASLTPASLTPASFPHTADHGANTSMFPPGPSRHYIDPSAIPLLQGQDDDLLTPHIIAQAQGYVQSPKVAGTRRGAKPKSNKSKGKEKENLPRTKQGHPQGANNYSVSNTNMLLNIIKDELPIGQRGWLTVMTKFNKRAIESGRPERKQTSLETKFKQLVKTTKPTGNGVCPPEIKRAHHIDSLINERAGTHDLGDSDFDDADGGRTGPSSDDDSLPQPEPRVAVARSARNEAPPPCCNAHGIATTGLLNSLSNAFDPTVQRARDEDQASRSLANTQLLTLSQQLHDSQATNESLRGQLFDLCNRMYEAQHTADRAEMCLKMMRAAPGPAHPVHSMYHNLLKHKRQSYRWFVDGGESRTWCSDDDCHIPCRTSQLRLSRAHSGPSPLSPPSVPPLLRFSVPPHFRLLLNILVPVP
ncbi:hypothetical protein PAXRUDRAFT_167937 [Paxillus rubicundulus Ve08.2h10]|uniref:DUF6818 domain-containing protein n=1 Tax=Paxillus rubicundulus Ve08.2h10 TaxID=930991 RepID=A0A0D0D9E7_9AGAM|nr:hypothetical protein PAXRUDRAFT_167937 [Paxillus rubicundulus Ve08.2h10]